MNRLLALLPVLALLASCASTPPPPAPPPVEFVAPEQSAWSARGKFSFRGPGGGESGQFIWIQDDRNYQLRLSGPLGIGGAEVLQHADGVTIRSNGSTYEAADATELLYELTGLWVPVTELPGLLLGEHVTLQSGWRLSYHGVIEMDNYRLPSRFILRRNGVELQIVISQWLF